jgi:citrate lyase subunit beta/citryl-CoA lyase
MFVPGNSRKFIDKALDHVPADVLLLDLEDGVPPAEKAGARALVAEALGRQPGRAARFVRLNSIRSEWFADDVATAVVPGCDGVCLPKAESPDEVLELAGQLAGIERRHGLKRGSIGIMALIESARGLIAAPSIAAAHPVLGGLMMGGEDFSLDLGLPARREGEARELIYARSALVVAAAAARKIAVDVIFPDLEDAEGLREETVQARRLGFTGKSTFNPRQVEVINELFDPTAEEIEYARRVVQGFEDAQARGDGSVSVGGQLVDQPIVDRARRLLEAMDEIPTSGGA